MYLFSVRYCRRLFFVATPDASSITLASVMKKESFSKARRERSRRDLPKQY